jgi:hypothetical protein
VSYSEIRLVPCRMNQFDRSDRKSVTGVNIKSVLKECPLNHSGHGEGQTHADATSFET